jgi:flagellar biosynthesis/type III secretory pathway M-ring protein FliF/YscJ
MNLEEAVWYVAAAYAVVLVALLLLFALLARRLVRLTQRVNALREGADQSTVATDGDAVRAAVEAVLDDDGATRPDAAAGGETVGAGAGAAAASAGRDVGAGVREGHDDRPPGEV